LLRDEGKDAESRELFFSFTILGAVWQFSGQGMGYRQDKWLFRFRFTTPPRQTGPEGRKFGLSATRNSAALL